MQSRNYRVVLYSHDTMGLGHMRRNLLVAGALRSTIWRPSTLLIAGAREITGFTLPPGADCLSLPALWKDRDAQYRARDLKLTLYELTALRGAVIREALASFDPHVFIVDNVPRGAERELEPALAQVRARGRTRCVLGLRDILDDPARVRREWERAENEDAIRRYYDAVWVYGDPRVCDVVREYGLAADIAARVRYTGYLDQRARLAAETAGEADPLTSLDLPPGRLALCLVGGGQDGVRLAEAFAGATFPRDVNAVLVTGPMMPAAARRRLQRQSARRARLRVLPVLPEPAALMARADYVIAMGGYNTTCEILSFEKPALIVPRVSPRLEQWIRAERLRELGLVDVLHPDHLTPDALARWLERAAGPRVRARDVISLRGLERLRALLGELVAPSRRLAPYQTRDLEVRHAAP